MQYFENWQLTPKISDEQNIKNFNNYRIGSLDFYLFIFLVVLIFLCLTSMWLSMVLYNVSCVWCALLCSRYCHFFFVVEQNWKLSLNSPTCEDHCLVMYYLTQKLKQGCQLMWVRFSKLCCPDWLIHSKQTCLLSYTKLNHCDMKLQESLKIIQCIIYIYVCLFSENYFKENLSKINVQWTFLC